MTAKEKERYARIMKQHKADTLYVTKDNMPFFAKNLAENHAKSKKYPAPEKITLAMVTDKADDKNK